MEAEFKHQRTTAVHVQKLWKAAACTTFRYDYINILAKKANVSRKGCLNTNCIRII